MLLDVNLWLLVGTLVKFVTMLVKYSARVWVNFETCLLNLLKIYSYLRVRTNNF